MKIGKVCEEKQMLFAASTTLYPSSSFLLIDNVELGLLFDLI